MEITIWNIAMTLDQIAVPIRVENENRYLKNCYHEESNPGTPHPGHGILTTISPLWFFG